MTETVKDLYNSLNKYFEFRPTNDQEVALNLLADFCLRSDYNEIFLLKGYAGTGKTTLIKSLVKALPHFNRKVVLMAPTGRAAKVMTQYSSQRASTIHRYIYKPKRNSKGGMSFHLNSNKAAHTFYIVDEASMIQDDAKDFNLLSGGLLHDLMEFVKKGMKCKLILVGDTAQLPPVGSLVSPALEAEYLSSTFNVKVKSIELRDVMRQTSESGILSNATLIRHMQKEEKMEPPKLEVTEDLIRLLEGFEIEDALQDSFKLAGRENTAIIVRSNKRANLYNQQIRQRILWQEDEISAGDLLMVVKNNYFWLGEDSKAGFIANGDIIELLEIYEYVNLYEFRFARVKVRMVDYEEMESFETILMLDVLNMPAPSLKWEDGNKLYNRILEDFQDIPQKYKRHQKVQANPYFNALQVKFAYAVTCHKAQGGQWDNIFIEQPWLPEGEIDMEYLRWLYTALTRAKEKVYLINFRDEYFKNGESHH